MTASIFFMADAVGWKIAGRLAYTIGLALRRRIGADFVPLGPGGRDRIAPILAETARRDPDADRGLPSLVFVDLDEAYHAAHVLRVVAHRDDFYRALVQLDVGFENAVERIVRRQRVLIDLVGPQLRGRSAGDDPFRYHAAEAVPIMTKPVHHRLVDVLQHRESAGHVTVEGRVTDGHLRLVARREHNRAELVRQGH